MTEIAIAEEGAVATAPPVPSLPAVQQLTGLQAWAAEARAASQIASSLARTTFVPMSMRGQHTDPDTAHEITVGNVTAAILSGQELGLQPMASLRSMDIIQGVPALRAHAMRGLVQSHGHDVEVVSATPQKVVMRGKRKGKSRWQTVEWDLDRARLLGLTGKNEWKKQPQTMLTARATGEICRLIASDVLFAMPYAAEELDPATAASLGSTAVSVTTEEILGAIEPAAVIPAGAEANLDEYDGHDEAAEIPHDDHPDGEFDSWCPGCRAESVAMEQEDSR
jgi:hypothetical protein